MDVKTNPQRSRTGTLEREVIASSALSSSQSKVDTKLSNGFEFTNISDSGTVNITASADVMKEFPVGVYVYDIQQKVGDTITTILQGSFKVNEDISS